MILRSAPWPSAAAYGRFESSARRPRRQSLRWVLAPCRNGLYYSHVLVAPPTWPDPPTVTSRGMTHAPPPPGQLMPLGEEAPRMARVLRLLANPDRLRMLCRMGMADELGGAHPTVGELVVVTGLSQSRVSQHLALLREAGIVMATREGQQVRYALVDPRVRAVMEALCDLCERGLPPSRLDGPAARRA